VTGQNTREDVAAYLEEVLMKCLEMNCTRVLIEERLEGPRLDIMDVYQIVNDKSSQAIGKFEAIAYVDLYAEGDSMQFAAMVAKSRSLPIHIFSTVEEAEDWLSEK